MQDYLPSAANDFQVISKLGEGSFSKVFKVKRISDGLFYAMKQVKMNMLNPKEKENALTEIRILASINDNNIIAYKETFFDAESQLLYLIIEYADGGDLSQKIQEYKRKRIHFTETFIWKVLIQSLQALKTLHDHNILHRDLKAANIFLMQNGQIKIGDLNVSKVAKRGMASTQTGTPYYASPEVWAEKEYDAKSDIWSLGCILYELCMQKPPFNANDMNGLSRAVQKGSFENISPRYSNDLQQIIYKCLKTQPSQRPSSNQLLQNDIIQKQIMFMTTQIDDVPIGMEWDAEEGLQDQKQLLGTIKVPKDLQKLKENLPKPQYQRKRKYVSSQNSNNIKQQLKIQAQQIQQQQQQQHKQQISNQSPPKGILLNNAQQQLPNIRNSIQPNNRYLQPQDVNLPNQKNRLNRLSPASSISHQQKMQNLSLVSQSVDTHLNKHDSSRMSSEIDKLRKLVQSNNQKPDYQCSQESRRHILYNRPPPKLFAYHHESKLPPIIEERARYKCNNVYESQNARNSYVHSIGQNQPQQYLQNSHDDEQKQRNVNNMQLHLRQNSQQHHLSPIAQNIVDQRKVHSGRQQQQSQQYIASQLIQNNVNPHVEQSQHYNYNQIHDEDFYYMNYNRVQHNVKDTTNLKLAAGQQITQNCVTKPNWWG